MKPTPVMRDRILLLVRQEIPHVQICKRLGCTLETIRRVIVERERRQRLSEAVS